jgi:hypothetical protein
MLCVFNFAGKTLILILYVCPSPGAKTTGIKIASKVNILDCMNGMMSHKHESKIIVLSLKKILHLNYFTQAFAHSHTVFQLIKSNIFFYIVLLALDSAVQSKSNSICGTARR